MRMHVPVMLILCSLVAVSIAAVPIELNHQGRLLDSDGSPLTGSFDLTYRIFDVESGGAPLWEETQQVATDDGLFDVILGETVPLDLSGFGIRPDSLWLEIQVGADPPLSPRTQMTATPMSAVSQSVRGDIVTEPGVVRLDASSSIPGRILIVDSTGDTTFSTRSNDDGVISTHTWTQTGGPYKFDTQAGATESGGSVGALAISPNFDTSGVDISAKVDRTVLKTFFETGDVPTEAGFSSSADSSRLYQQAGNYEFELTVTDNRGLASMKQKVVVPGEAVRRFDVSVDDTIVSHRLMWDAESDLGPACLSEVDSATSKIMLKAAAERAFDAVISVGPKGGDISTDSLGGTFSFQSVSADLLDTSSVYSLEANATGAAMHMVNPDQDTTVTIAGADGNGGGWKTVRGGGLRITESGINGMGQDENNEIVATGKALRVTTSLSDGLGGYDTLGTMVAGPDSVALVDSSGATAVALKKGDRIALVGFGSFSGGADPDTSFAFDTLGNAQLAGSITIGPIEPLATLTVAGDICATGAIGACSDVRYKTDVEAIPDVRERVTQLRGVTYRWKHDEYPDRSFDDRRHIGFIAQEVETVFPEMVLTDRNGYKSIDYSRLTPALVEAMKEQQAQIDKQQLQIDAQQRQINELKDLVTRLVENNAVDSDITYGSR